jgi:hypothetical protein
MENLYAGSVVVSQYDNGISYEIQLHVVEVGGRLTLSKANNSSWVPLRKLHDFARSLYTGVFTNNRMFIADSNGNNYDVRFDEDWTKVFK